MTAGSLETSAGGPCTILKIDWAGINQLDRLDDKFAVVVRSGTGDIQNLETLALP